MTAGNLLLLMICAVLFAYLLYAPLKVDGKGREQFKEWCKDGANLLPGVGLNP